MEDAAPVPATPTKRRRNQIPHIHDDSEDCLSANKQHDLSESLRSPQTDKRTARTVTTKRTVQNRRIVLSPAKANIQAKSDAIVTTPEHQRFKDALDAENFQTPKRVVRSVGRPFSNGIRTPSNLAKGQSIYSSARQSFSQTSESGPLVGRDAERQTISSFLSTSIRQRTGGCLYISGPPGTGKSALLQEALAGVPQDDTVRITQINCVSMKTSKDVYTNLLRDFSADQSPCRSPETTLSSIFTAQKKNDDKVFIVMLDEIDHLTSDFEVLGQLFEWSLSKNSRLALIGIANALDLTDRFLPQLKSRNLKPKLLPFQSYTATQIASIITQRLQVLVPEDCMTPNFVPFVHPAAIQLCAKKVASQTGDLRKAFSIIRRALDVIEKETLEKQRKASTLQDSSTKQPLADNVNFSSPESGMLSPPMSSPLKAEVSPAAPQQPSKIVETAPRATVAHVARVCATIFNNGTTQRLSGLNLQQKAVLCSLVAMEKQKLARMKQRDPFTTPSKSANTGPPTVREMFNTYTELCKRDHVLHPLTATEFRDVVDGLETLGLINESRGKLGSFKIASMTTPTRTPSRLARTGAEDKQMCSAVTEKEMEECIQGPGMEILRALLLSTL